ncbi:Cytochrome oxidase assembly protein ShyY1 [Colwellia chukchiensis]|uniref:SURF1-like protein n=1 Tax=Colwellia chukchiensis TaxID=641665 RepID=A0A1H7Q0M5_9GAMM|nr:SURF1 family protein [Colwellia chukchiensis]SEL41562.1 Cytochrome oxidase assembly protein ShyY1 [Colwellia chukchiensis]
MNLVSFQQHIKQLNWPMVIFTMLVFSLLIKLGFWQSSRALEKEQRLQRISKLSQQQALSLAQVLAISGLQDGINDLPVALTGEFIADKIFLLDNQLNNGRLGYRVFQFMTHNQQAVLVNLGWVAGSVDRQALPEILPLTGQHTITGHIREIEVGIQLQEQDLTNVSWPLRIQQIELDKFSSFITQPLLPFVVYLDTKESIGFEKNWQPIVMPPEKHRAYAFQWFSLACAWLILMVWAAFKASANERHLRDEDNTIIRKG